MPTDRLEAKWIDVFVEAFALSKAGPGDAVAILSETQSRTLNVQLAELALARLGCRAFHLVVPSPRQTAPVPVRSTGASDALQRLGPVIQALKASALVVDLTVEGLLHAPELPEILSGGARVLMVSNEHPEVLERLGSDAGLAERVRLGLRRLRAAAAMRVTSPAGTDLAVRLEGARPGASWGFTDRPGTVSHWPGGLCLCFPAKGAVSGRLVLAPGDLNLTFKRYVETPVTLAVESDYVTDIAGDGLDAQLMRSYLAAWGDPEAYGVSHVGWGMNHGARWDAAMLYDKGDINGTEQRAFAGNFLYSTGANEVAQRFTLGHFDLPLKGCTIRLDDSVIVDGGVLQGELA